MSGGTTARRTVAMIVGFVVLGLAWGQGAWADGISSVTITATVLGATQPQNPTVQFFGYAAPQAHIIVWRDGTQVGSATAADSADFSVSLTDQPVGQATFQISGVDSDSRPLAPLSFALSLAMDSNTIINGVFLGPSISIDKTSVKLGQYVTLAGVTVPGSAVTVSISSAATLSFSVAADAQGLWSKLVNTQDVGVGTHSAFARSLLGSSQISAASAAITFAVNPLEQCDGKMTADLNCDGRVDLFDFSILMFFWQQTTPANSRTDINHDGRVDVVDFSIMLYQWTG